MKSKMIVIAIVLIVAAILFFVAGPKLLTWMIKKTPAQVPVKTAPIKIKASGSLSQIDEHIVLTTPRGTNNYVLVGTRTKELQSLAGSKQNVFVFGSLMSPDPKNIGGKEIRYRIEVDEFNTKDFTIGQKLSTEVADAIKKKVQDKTTFREATLKKLGIKDPNMDVVAGKMAMVESCLYMGDPKEQFGIMIQDKYGDFFFLLNGGALKKPYKQYLKIAAAEIEVIVVGKVSLMDPSVILTLPASISYVPFSAVKVYNSDLTDLILDSDSET